MYNIGAGSKDISPMNWGKYKPEIPPIFYTSQGTMKAGVLLCIEILKHHLEYFFFCPSHDKNPSSWLSNFWGSYQNQGFFFVFDVSYLTSSLVVKIPVFSGKCSCLSLYYKLTLIY